jgi:MoxR-like ATPase
MSTQFPQYDPWFILGKVLDAKTPRVLLYGPPGTGKSLTPCLWAQDNNWAFFSVTLTEETPMSELRGHFVLKGQEFVWHDGLIARAWRLSHSHPQGVLVVLNEIDHAGADVQSFLHNALDDPAMARMDLPGDETISPAVGKVIYVGTMNGRAEDLPDALRDRFPVTIEMPTPNPQALAALPPDLRTLATNSATSKDRDRRISPRAFFEFANLRGPLGDQLAAAAIFGAAAPDLVNALTLARAR